MPRPISLGLSASEPRRDHGDSTASSPTPTLKKAKSRLSRLLLHRKSFETKDVDRMQIKDDSKRSKSLNRRTMATQVVGGGVRDIRWDPMPQRHQHDPHKLSMVSEHDEPLEPTHPRAVVTRSPICEVPRPEIRRGSRPENRPDSAKSSLVKVTSASTSKHDSMLTDYSDLCAIPNEEPEEQSELQRSLRQIHELPSTVFSPGHSRTPSSSAPIPCSSSGTGLGSSSSSLYSDADEIIRPVSPMAMHALDFVPQVTAMDVANLPDFSCIPNAMHCKHQSEVVSATFPGSTNVVTDWQVECFRLRKQLKAVELQLRYKAELLASERGRVQSAEAEVDRTKTELQLVRGEAQLLRVSNGLKHDETCALKAELDSMQSGDQNKNNQLTYKLRAMAERLALEEDAVADKDLRIKWLEKEREELERENQVLKNVKGALWGHMERARKRDSPIAPAVPEGQPHWWI
ncbi:hypothetical protein CERZMDRAFT_82511 [Cercospora zeae-maydis SCOH1-5]|uniref:Uncharacterized protein n=1 Tax=Cercospora zeae-maydis SCOH1-5 TaxID=717836 RepID=A0A6A6FQ65_9PEZI|nr:hypothetical protein CERZMDRAFT_82511 [Cercospora zeae-maydis SCOH1-5]